MKKEKTPIKGLSVLLDLTCKKCGAAYKGSMKYMMKRGLRQGRCGKCLRKDYSISMRRFFIKHSAQEVKKERVEQRLIDYITNATNKRTVQNA